MLQTTSPAQLKRWQALTAHLHTYFYKPDIEALEVALSAACGQYLIQRDPVWLLVIGPPSSGKTSVIVTACDGLPDSYIMGTVTPKSFISHYKGEVKGILNELPNHRGTLLFKDFTSIISMRDDDQREIFSQLREIYDGEWKRDTGTHNGSLWQGCVTVLAACTPAIERAWKMQRELGERFVAVRWPRVGGTQMSHYAAKQRGKEKLIAESTKRLALEFCDPGHLSGLPPIPDEMSERIYNMAEMVANLRSNVIRDNYGTREIIDVPDAEENPRLSKALGLLVGTHAALWRREPTLDDFRMAKRTCMDSIPQIRRRLFEILASAPRGTKFSRSEISKLTAIPSTTVHRHAEELGALQVMEIFQNNVGEHEYVLTDKYFEMVKIAFQ